MTETIANFVATGKKVKAISQSLSYHTFSCILLRYVGIRALSRAFTVYVSFSSASADCAVTPKSVPLTNYVILPLSGGESPASRDSPTHN